MTEGTAEASNVLRTQISRFVASYVLEKTEIPEILLLKKRGYLNYLFRSLYFIDKQIENQKSKIYMFVRVVGILTPKSRLLPTMCYEM